MDKAEKKAREILSQEIRNGLFDENDLRAAITQALSEYEARVKELEGSLRGIFWLIDMTDVSYAFRRSDEVKIAKAVLGREK